MTALASLFRDVVSNHGVFDRRMARHNGVSAKQVRRLLSSGEVEQFSSDVFLVRGMGDPALKPMMAAARAIPGSAVAARSTCQLTELGNVSTSVVDLWIPENATRKKLPGVRLWRNAAINRDTDVTRVSRIRSLKPSIALTQVGAAIGDVDLEHCVDDFMRTYGEQWLQDTLIRFGSRGRPGIGALRRVLNAPHRVQGVTDSWMERMLSTLVSIPGLPPVELQTEVIINGRTYRIDVGVPLVRLGLEAHSRTFHFGPTKENADNVRDLDFASAGWHLLYLTWHQINDPEGFAHQFGRIVRRRAADLHIRI